MATGTATSRGESKDVASKLRIKPGSSLWVSDEAVLPSIGALPDNVELVETPGVASVALVVARDKAALHEQVGRHRPGLARAGVLWVAYPKTDRIDLSRDSVWPILGEYAMRPIGQAAIGDEWSAMRFRPLADGEKPFTGGR